MKFQGEQDARIAELEADLKHGIFPGWQSYEEWVADGRSSTKEWQDEFGEGGGK